jgi:tetratricopeptide (TPR) repeat protein
MASAENKTKAQALKEKANAAYGRKDYTEALKLYSDALKLDPENHILLSNRSVTHYQMKNYVLAIMDALHARKIDQSWLKASYHEGIAALAMKRYLQAKEAFKRCLELEPGHASGLEMLNAAENEHIAAYYDIITATTKLRILYKGLVRGKGVFTKASFKQDECILTEVPLVSHMHVAMLSKNIFARTA